MQLLGSSGLGLVVLECETNSALIIVREWRWVELRIISFCGSLDALLNLLIHSDSHGIANGVVSLHIGMTLTINQEVATNHCWIPVPVLQVVNHLLVFLLKLDCRGMIGHLVFTADIEGLFLYEGLALNIASNHSLGSTN